MATRIGSFKTQVLVPFAAAPAAAKADEKESDAVKADPSPSKISHKTALHELSPKAAYVFQVYCWVTAARWPGAERAFTIEKCQDKHLEMIRSAKRAHEQLQMILRTIPMLKGNIEIDQSKSPDDVWAAPEPVRKSYLAELEAFGIMVRSVVGAKEALGDTSSICRDEVGIHFLQNRRKFHTGFRANAISIEAITRLASNYLLLLSGPGDGKALNEFVKSCTRDTAHGRLEPRLFHQHFNVLKKQSPDAAKLLFFSIQQQYKDFLTPEMDIIEITAGEVIEAVLKHATAILAFNGKW